MTKKNLSLLKRSSNRGSTKPLVVRDEANKEQFSPTSDPSRLWNEPVFGAYSKLYIPSGDMDLEWQPSVGSVFKILFSLRISAAMWSAISDCDEVYNYWEPLHLFLYGNGFQTWEYSPKYAIRSYLYIILHYGPGLLLRSLFSTNKIGVFITMRCLLGLINVFAEIKLYKALCNRFGNGIARIYVVLSILSSGMFTSCCAFLPSSFSMSMNLFAIAAYINNEWFVSIFFTACSALIGWPFAAILGIPVVLEMLLIRTRQLHMLFISYSLISGGIIITLLILVDSYYYGKTVLAPLNIILYNIFTPHGPDLYGVEDVTYYIKNLLLNWNLTILMAPLAVPLAAYVFVRSQSFRNQAQHLPAKFSVAYWQRFLPVIFISVSLFSWLLIFFAQPHKEERFLFPVYPLIALLAAVTLDAIPRVGAYALGGGTRKIWNIFVSICISIFIILSLSRSAALHRNYSAPMEVFKNLNEHLSDPKTLDTPYYASLQNHSTIHICIGKEWYRFPSSFFIPSIIIDRKGRRLKAELNFIKSEFSGILPKPFVGGSLPDITRVVPSDMNDVNREEPSRYVNVESCDFLVDLELPDTSPLEPNYAEQDTTWKVIIRRRFLLASYSKPIWRAFYIPFFADTSLRFGNYHVLERIR